MGFRGDRQILDERTKDMTESPGVYVFRDAVGEVLYVGKAKNLRKRLRSYFASALPPKTEALMERAFGLETITVDSEVEALILELNLIKKHSPKYNIMLTDDKQYPYIRVGVSEKWPRVTVARRVQRDGARYFGPFTRSGSVRETLAVLRRLFPFRNCSDRALAQAQRPCLDYYIGRCLGPCTGKIHETAYKRTIDEVVKFLEGKHRAVRESLQTRMLEEAGRMDFESAARVRDQIKSLDDITEKQRIVSPDKKDRDVLGLARTADTAFVALLPVREGKITGKEGFILKGAGAEEDAGILEAFVSQYYSQAPFVPGEILLPSALPPDSDLGAFLRKQKKRNEGKERAVRLKTPKRGRLRELVLMAGDNAKTMMADIVPRQQRQKEENLAAMHDLSLALGMPALPIRIEGYDISNISGQETVGAMVVLRDGRPDKSQYRRFRMKVQAKPDDFAMMQEVLWRRFTRGLKERREMEVTGRGGKFSVFPDLVLVDGGKGQVNAAKKVLDELALDIPLAGLAEKNEEIFLPGQRDPLVLSRDSGALYLVMRLRDEAHRFAVTYHRRLRGEKALRSALSRIPGIGPVKRKELLTAFGDVESIRQASLDDIAKVKGVGPALARTIAAHLSRK